MMICKADFDELFPCARQQAPSAGETQAPEQKLTQKPASPSAACLARWEDDGGADDGVPGRIRPKARRPVSRAAVRSDPMEAGFMLASMPAVAAYGAAMTMLASLAMMPKH
jgi:hypothetical protein